MVLTAASVLAAAALSSLATASAGEIVVGLMCDRTGPTASVGTFLCPGYHDYVALVNSKGGIMGNKVRVVEVDHQYKVPPAMEAYQRMKQQGAVIIGIYGTPQTQAVTPLLAEDHIPGTSPGFGSAAAANGKKYPYLFPIAATYWSQAGAAVKFAQDQLGGSLKGKKIAYLYYDNPAGREPLPVMHALAKKLGFELKEFGIPPPGVEAKVQAQDIARRFRADFVITHTFGKAPSVVINELARNGYPLNKVIGFVWAAGESNIMGAGGWDKAQGYYCLQFAGAGENYPVLDEIKAMYKKEGKQPPEEMKSTVYYNRGVLTAAVHLAAIENAVKAKGGSSDITGEDVKKGFEQIKGLSLGGLIPPLEITPEDHEGGGWVRVFQVKGNGFVPATDWMHGYRDVVMSMVQSGE
jgi:branched-chain amino acid transport system substrate-binding protein